MAYPERRTFGPRQEEKNPEEGRGKFRFEFGGFRLIFFTFSLLATMVWMFVFGVMVGREHSLVELRDFSFRAQFLRFLGFGRQPAPVPADTAATWTTPEKMLESLRYHESLSEGTAAVIAPAARDASAAELKNPAKDPKSAVPAPDGSQGAQDSKSPTTAANAKKPPAKTEAVPESGERYSLLISSFQSKDKAQKLVEQFKAKGYPARLQVVEGRMWRVLVGKFENHEKAKKFLLDFNQKEHLTALVIREAL
jgi:cell division septation protein DedD